MHFQWAAQQNEDILGSLETVARFQHSQSGHLEVVTVNVALLAGEGDTEQKTTGSGQMGCCSPWARSRLYGGKRRTLS
jgi:hypothetical protein